VQNDARAQITRLTHAWRALEPEQRLAALAALGLFASMFLPWYSKTDTLVVHDLPKATATSLSAFQAFSFVEAAVLLVSAGMLTMLFARAEGGTFQLPGGDGLITTLAGGWCALLIFYRLLDKPGLQGNARVTATVGVEWGIFIALLLALALALAGRRMRALERPPPPLSRARNARHPDAAGYTREPDAPGYAREPDAAPAEGHDEGAGRSWDEEPTVLVPGGASARRSGPRAGRRRGRFPPAPGEGAPPTGEQLSFEDPPARP
jgi:hypothetical protein